MIQWKKMETQKKCGFTLSRHIPHSGKAKANRWFIPLMVALLGGWLISAGVLKAADQQESPEEILLQSEGYKSRKKGPVNFTHLDHAENYDVACSECHHVYKDGKNVWEEGQPVQKCGECHNPVKSEGNVKKLQIAFHRNCKDCHEEKVKEGISEDAPYKKCNDCHAKKS